MYIYRICGRLNWSWTLGPRKGEKLAPPLTTSLWLIDWLIDDDWLIRTTRRSTTTTMTRQLPCSTPSARCGSRDSQAPGTNRPMLCLGKETQNLHFGRWFPLNPCFSYLHYVVISHCGFKSIVQVQGVLFNGLCCVDQFCWNNATTSLFWLLMGALGVDQRWKH